MIDSTFVEAILSQAHPVDVDGRVFTPPGWNFAKRTIPLPVPLEMNTLSAIVDYAQKGGIPPEKFWIHVSKHDEVKIIGDLASPAEDFVRPVFCRASLGMYGTGFPFATWLNLDEFVIALQTQFEALDGASSPNIKELVRLISNITDGIVRTEEDSGTSQEVTIKRGATLANRVTIPNPVKLAPYRTFREVDQPPSLFVLRLQSARSAEERPRLALFEADGGAWKAQAIEDVMGYLRDHLTEEFRIIA